MRDAIATSKYWNEWSEFEASAVAKSIDTLSRPFGNPNYKPQYVYDLAFMHLRMLLQNYSRGDSIAELSRHIDPLLRYWEEAEVLGKVLWSPAQQKLRHAWSENLGHYIDCFWLVGLALCLNVPDETWQRLLALIGNEGEDVLLDRIIATRQPERKVGNSLCYPKPYAKMLDAVDAAPAKQGAKLLNFVDDWYSDLKSAVRNGRTKQGYPIKQPYWYEYHRPMKGAYFGYWCIEAAAAVKAFKLDDSLCIGHPNYPGDLLRPGSITKADILRLPKALMASIHEPPPFVPGTPQHISNWEALKRIVMNKFKS